MAIKLIVTDIDGTLCNSLGKISPATKQVFKKCRELGIHICLSSGRDFEILKPILIEMDMLDEGFACSCNGAFLHDLKNKKEYSCPSFTKQQLQIILDFAYKNHTKVLFAEGRNMTCYAVGIDRLIEEIKAFFRKILVFNYGHYKLSRQIDFIEPKAEEVKYDYHKAIFLGNHEKLSYLYNEMKKSFCDDFSFFFSGKTVIDVAPKGIDKGVGVKKLMKLLDIKEDEVLCFGDSQNDIYMFEVAKYSVAMNNANDEVKKKAYYVTASNDENGVEKALIKFLDLTN